jgi:hypothetical protein
MMTLATILRPMTANKSGTICRGKETGAWLSALLSTVNGTVLSAQEFQDALLMRYAETPHKVPRYIHGHANENMKTSPNKITNQNIDKEAATGEDERGTDCILDVRVTDTDSKSYCKRTPSKVLESQEKEKKRKYLGACLENRRHFTPFVLSVDGLRTRTRSSNFRETSRSKACRKVAEALFASSGIRESKAEHSSSSCHTFVLARKQSSSAQYQRPIFSMGRRSWSSHA